MLSNWMSFVYSVKPQVLVILERFKEYESRKVLATPDRGPKRHELSGIIRAVQYLVLHVLGDSAASPNNSRDLMSTDFKICYDQCRASYPILILESMIQSEQVSKWFLMWLIRLERRPRTVGIPTDSMLLFRKRQGISAIDQEIPKLSI